MNNLSRRMVFVLSALALMSMVLPAQDAGAIPMPPPVQTEPAVPVESVPAPIAAPAETPAPVAVPVPTPAPVATPVPTPAPIAAPVPTPAPTPAPTPSPAQTVPAAPVITSWYEIDSQLTLEATLQLGRELDARANAYQQLFRFDAGANQRKMRVRAFANKSAFDAYLTGVIGGSRDGSIYLHYSKPEKCELVLFRAPGFDDKNLNHQGFIQFLRSFIPNPPSWMREGVAVYFDSLRYDAASGTLIFDENLSWLDTVKKWGDNLPSIESVLNHDVVPAVNVAQLTPASWALISFLLKTEIEDYRRCLFEGFMVLDPAASAQENSKAVSRRMTAFLDMGQARADFLTYLRSRKTFNELIEEGRAAYARKEFDTAEYAFMDAAVLRPLHYAPHYYLGLTCYERKEYDQAEMHYTNALRLGADEGLINYAMGVNALAAKRTDDARAFLLKAKEKAPDRYGARADELLSRIN